MGGRAAAPRKWLAGVDGICPLLGQQYGATTVDCRDEISSRFEAARRSRRSCARLEPARVAFLVPQPAFFISPCWASPIFCLNFYLVSIGYDTATISLLQSLPRLSGFLIGLPIGLIANRVGNRRLIMLSTAGIALSVATTALTQSLPIIALSRFLWGACFGANQVVKPPFMVTLTDRSEHTAQFAYHNLVAMLAVAIGSVLGGALRWSPARACRLLAPPICARKRCPWPIALL